MYEEPKINRRRLCIIIAVCAIILAFAVYLIACLLPPSSVDCSKAVISFSDEDYDISGENAALITPDGDRIESDAAGISVSGSTVTILSPGTYRLTGSLEDGCIYVASQDDGTVHLILSDTDLSCSDSPPIYIAAANQAVITVEDGTENRITASADSGLESAVYSACDLSFRGTGKLQLSSENGIAVNCKMNLQFSGGSYALSAKENGIQAEYSVSVQDCVLNLTSEADGIRTTGAGQADGIWVGSIIFDGGTTTISCTGDAVSSDSVICIRNGTLDLTSGGGSTQQQTAGFGGMGGMGGPPEEQTSTKSSQSAKGLKAESGICISGGTLTIDSADDAVHSDRDVTITAGTLTLLANDDGIHGDSSVNISGGSISIERCTEGIEGHYITIDSGDLQVTASDDGINATPGNNPIASLASLLETEFPGTGGRLFINGGNLHVTSSGDGLDSNGSIVQTGGNVVVTCRANGADGALDFDGSYSMTGGQLAAFGNSGMMLQTITASKSTVCCVSIGQTFAEGSTVEVEDAAGTVLLSLTSEAAAGTLVLASEALTQGSEITVFVDGTEVGSAVLTEEPVQIGTISESEGGPGAGGPEGDGREEMPGASAPENGNQASSGEMQPGSGDTQPGSGYAQPGGGDAQPGGGDAGRGGPGEISHMLQWILIAAAVFLAAVISLIVIHRKKKRKGQKRDLQK